MDISPLIDKIRDQFSEIETSLSDPATVADRERFVTQSREHQRLSVLLNAWDSLQDAKSQLADNKAMLGEETDEEFRQMIADDIETLEKSVEPLEKKVMVLVLPPGENDSRNIIVEIRPAAGGDEAALFVGDLYRMYSRYAEHHGWKMELLHLTDTDLGGIKEVAFSLQGDSVYRAMQHEGGVHRVQRIPTTETGGRIHTSTVTVALMPEATAVDVQINPDELEIVTCRASGPGGQCVNTSDAAVQITNIPRGFSVKSK
jgi:peptide chain release factor 1